MDATNELTTTQSLLRNACADVLRLENGIVDRKTQIAVLVSGLARIASNLGRGGLVGGDQDKGSRPLRVAATECLKSTGLVYREYPSVPDDGWYLGDELIGTW